MELDEIRAFVAIASFRSVTRAADALRISQPCLTRKLVKLEGTLGFDLFERRGPTMEITPAGEVLLGHATRLSRDYDEALSVARELAVHTSAHRLRGRMRISRSR